LVDRWATFWFAAVPPHSFAVLRILLGSVGLLAMAGLTPVELYWPLDGIVPVSSGGGIRTALEDAGLGLIAGWAAYGLLLAAFVAMTLGYRSDLAVLICFIGLVLQQHWNRLPLSSAHQVMVNLMFCLVWTETGRVWSIDAACRRAAAGRDIDPPDVPRWPLWLMRFQIALVYGSSGLWKLAYPIWRDGSAVHWALSLNGFHRFPWAIPAAAEPVLALLTWGTLMFEIAFPVLVFFRRTRAFAILGGVGLHLGLGLTLELGPFSAVMIASYAAFLDPERTPALMRQWSGWFARAGLFARGSGRKRIRELDADPTVELER
jgi:hypothetical protein